MKLTAPHMGNCYIAIEALFSELGHDFIVPPKCSKKTLDLGTKYSPETVCLPLKINIGNFIEAIELGAEVVVMIGGVGPCRLGYYAPVEHQILQELSHNIDFITLEHPRNNFKLLKSQLQLIMGKKGIRGLINGCRLAWEKLIAVERLETAAHFALPREREQGITTKTLDNYLSKIRQAVSIAQIRQTSLRGYDALQSIADNDVEPLRIGIIGEIYTIIEPFVNLNLEQRLGYLGVEVFRSVSIAEWITDHVVLNLFHLYSNKHLCRKAEGYLRGFVGGHGLESIARTITLSENHYDGVVHILPFTCMPEIIAQCILPRVSTDYNIPVLSLIVDEHTGETGYQTRLEAFVDLIARRLEEEAVNENKTSISRR